MAKNQDLPGMSNRKIKPLEELAAQYADLRDRRQAIGRDEAELKQKTIAAMKKLGKTAYQRDGISIELLPGEETIKVRVKPPADDADADADESEDDA